MTTDLRTITMHPYVSGAKRYSAEALDSDGRRALLSIRRFESRAARCRMNMREDVEVSGHTDAIPPRNNQAVREALLKTALADHKVTADLRAIINEYLHKDVL